MNDDQSRRRRRALVSLLVLLLLVGGYGALKATQHQEGELSEISTAQVRVSIGGQDSPLTDTSPAEVTSEPTATPRAQASNQRPSITAEVLSGTAAGDGTENARGSGGGTAGTSGGSTGGTSGAQAGATPRPTTATGTGLVIGAPRTAVPGSSNTAEATATAGVTQGGGPLPTATTSIAQPTATSVPSGAVATATTAPSAPTATAGPPTSVPAATSTPIPETVSPPGHHSHLHIDGFVAPGAYDNGGIEVMNVGTVAFNYSVSLVTTGDATFASLIRHRIYLRVGTSCNYPGQPPSGDTLLALTGDQVGTTLYAGSFASGNLIGNPAVLSATGDRVLQPGTSEILCMEVFFPWSAGNEYQGKTASGTFTFTAKAPDGT